MATGKAVGRPQEKPSNGCQKCCRTTVGKATRRTPGSHQTNAGAASRKHPAFCKLKIYFKGILVIYTFDL
ncbi:hypothetical protein L484_022588 [Morus notabilis]|uniref:Uncharacterized protein n=1 Tax=Morus notabilis TaxID=981085 RepID=W9RIW1_9ROSA|nr:hypothetical protein L484_022588 [Morus notabilis]